MRRRARAASSTSFVLYLFLLPELVYPFYVANYFSVPFWAAMLVLLIVASQHIWERQESELRRHPKDQVWSAQTVQRLALIPTRYISTRQLLTFGNKLRL